MSAAAGGTRAAGAQQTEWIDTDMPIVPVDGELAGLFVGGDVGRLLVHDSSEDKDFKTIRRGFEAMSIKLYMIESFWFGIRMNQ